MSKIQSSLDWESLKSNLIRTGSKLVHSRDVHKMIKNISVKVTELSRAEVAARRGRKHLAAELLIEVNQDIETVEEFLLVAALLG